MSRYHGERHHKAKTTLAVVRAIRASVEPTRVLAERYALSRSQVRKIRRREAWQHDT